MAHQSFPIVAVCLKMGTKVPNKQNLRNLIVTLKGSSLSTSKFSFLFQQAYFRIEKHTKTILTLDENVLTLCYHHLFILKRPTSFLFLKPKKNKSELHLQLLNKMEGETPRAGELTPHETGVSTVALWSAFRFTHEPPEIRILVIGKGGFSSSPLLMHAALKELGYNGME